MVRKVLGLFSSKRSHYLALLILFSGTVCANVPTVNVYRVEKRSYATEPEPQRFSISAHDKSFLVKPAILSYTQLNPLSPKAVYTLSPYPNVEFLPKIGKWMTIMDINSQGFVPAHWISLTNTRGQYIIEPINYMFIVLEANKQKAVDLLNAGLKKAGFWGTASENHSDGYYAYIGATLLSQWTSKTGQGLTYSNADFQFQNDHFRIFGAYPLSIHKRPAYIFLASVSEESGLETELARLPAKVLELKLAELKKQNAYGIYYENYGHHFVSFANARNNLAVALIKSGLPTYYSTLGNVVNTLGESSEDHDGNVYITVIK